MEGILGDSVEIIAEQSTYDVAKAEFEIKQEKQKLVRNKELDKFTTTGSVEGTDRGATAEVPVRRAAVAVEHITLAVLQNQLPKLPRELTVYFNEVQKNRRQLYGTRFLGTGLEKLVDWT